MFRIHSSSFRDPSGFVYTEGGQLYRQINIVYKANYDLFIKSGLYHELVERGFLIPHREIEEKSGISSDAYKIISPELIPFISYPYEWCFSQLKDAALLTLEIQKIALRFGMSLKDATPFNVQFHKGRPVFIDTLSFEKYYPDRPWVAYRQFCQNFAAPLALMAYTDIRLNKMFRLYLDGVPLDLASALLPFKSRFHVGALVHVHLHAGAQKRSKNFSLKGHAAGLHFSLAAFQGLIDSLQSFISSLKFPMSAGPWSQYYAQSESYSHEASSHKRQLIATLLDRIEPKSLWDIGANTGYFSEMAAKKGIPTVSFDMDHACTEIRYLSVKKNRMTNLLPLIVDIANPSPGIGWENEERSSLFGRGPVDTAMALALIHHLAISCNLPFSKIAHFFQSICRRLIIEYVPKEDPMAQELLSLREDIFGHYNLEEFRESFSRYFNIQSETAVEHSKRIIFLMEKKP